MQRVRAELYFDGRVMRFVPVVFDFYRDIGEIAGILHLPLQFKDARFLIDFAHFQRVDMMDDPFRIPLQSADFQRAECKSWAAVEAHRCVGLPRVRINAHLRVRDFRAQVALRLQRLLGSVLCYFPAFLGKWIADGERPGLARGGLTLRRFILYWAGELQMDGWGCGGRAGMEEERGGVFSAGCGGE